MNGIKIKVTYIHDPSHRELHCFVNVEIVMTNDFAIK